MGRHDIATLQRFLNAELWAVEAYRIVLEALPIDASTRDDLERAWASHYRRAELLSHALSAGSGVAASSVNRWSELASEVKTATAGRSESAVIAMLEAGEDHALAAYRVQMGTLGRAAQALVNARILPEQQRSCETLLRLTDTRPPSV